MKTGKIYLISQALAVFSLRGPKSVRMDDVALAAGISKRTLYEMFATKELLVEAGIKLLIEKNQQFIRVCSGMSPNALVELNNLFTYINRLALSTTPVFLYELKKYYTDQYQLIENCNKSLLGAFVDKNIARGIGEGIYRIEVEKEGLGSLYCWQLKKAMEDCTFRTEETQEVIFFVHNFFIHGILNAQGFKLLNAGRNMPAGIKKCLKV